MIISYKHNFIFIHNRKTAGSSIKVFLSPYLGDNDIMLGSWDECYLKGIHPNSQFVKDIFYPKSILNSLGGLIKRPDYLFRPAGLLNILSQSQKKKYGIGSHSTIEEIKKFDSKIFEEAFKFCFVRNPYERAVSDYLYRGLTNKITFRTYLEGVDSGKFRFKSWPMYTIKDEIVMDYVGKFENLREEMKKICKIIDIPLPNELPKMKRQNKYDYRKFYKEEYEINLLKKICEPEIEYFNYKF
ncbi:MAG TPA: sulfotransferase family 2 domain-containing protein [Balneolaceae bacterium]|nr:sulfotransferase family 2 domain-containing protein [Balneolaceae bacterium]